MKVINAGYSVTKPDLDDPKTYLNMLKEITECGHVAYKSTKEVTDENAEKFVRRLIRDGHESVLEHVNMRVLFTVDRGFSHELVRHRIASFTQESTRYCNYSQDKFGNEITVIDPFALVRSFERRNMLRLMDLTDTAVYDETDKAYVEWFQACQECEKRYFHMLGVGCTPEIARSVLPTSLKTEVVMTTNLREWRHILNLRAAGTTGKPHPQMLEVMVPLLNELRLKLPALFDDIQPME